METDTACVAFLKVIQPVSEKAWTGIQVYRYTGPIPLYRESQSILDPGS